MLVIQKLITPQKYVTKTLLYVHIHVELMNEKTNLGK